MILPKSEIRSYAFSDKTQSSNLTALPVSFRSFLTSVRRQLHMFPEVGFQELETSRFLRRHLESHGLQPVGPLAQTGFYVDITGTHPGPIIAYRCDMDALPIQDAKKTAYASRNNGVAHLCGHDAHMTIALGTALLLQQLREELHGVVRIFFQPNEEGCPSGSIPMIRDGVLEGVEAAYCLHVDPTLAVGVYGLMSGAVTASSDRFQAYIRTVSTGHSARPHQTRDIVWITTQLLNQFYQYAGRITDARNPAVFTVCIIKGGQAHNVIPSEIEFEGTLRCLSNEDRTYLKKYMQRTAKQFAALHEVTIDLDFKNSIPAVINDQHMTHNVRSTIEDLFGKDACLEISVPSMGSEDFAHYLDHIPGMLLRVGTRSNRHTGFPLHDAYFDVDEASLLPTVQLMSKTVINHLRNRIS